MVFEQCIELVNRSPVGPEAAFEFRCHAGQDREIRTDPKLIANPFVAKIDEQLSHKQSGVLA